MSAVCPACGVAVVPGYVRCPKCHAGLGLGTGRSKRSTVEPGGTAVEAKGFPIAAVAVALGVAASIILVFGVLRGTSKRTQAASTLPPRPIEAVRLTPAPNQARPMAAPVPAAPPEVAAPDPARAGKDLEASLRKLRLWSRVEITGPRLDVRSGSCADPAMRPAIEPRRAVLRSTGLTRLRCVEQSGAVVFEYEL
jgi:hypothetical protein